MSTARDLVRMQEGLSLRVYNDTEGKATVGYGHLVTDPLALLLLRRGVDLEESEADALFALDYAKARAQFHFEVDRDADEEDPRDAALLSAAFQLGSLGRWPKMIGAFRARRWHIVCHEAKTGNQGRPSKWAEQTPSRVAEFCEIMRTGEWPPRLSPWGAENAQDNP